MTDNSNSRATWTSTQDNCLRRLAIKGASRDDIAGILKRTRQAVVSRAKKLHIRLQRSDYGLWRAWLPADDQCLREMFAAGNHAGSIGVRLNRSLNAVYRRAMKLGISTVGRHITPAFWTDERVEQARVWWLQNKSASWIADQLRGGVTKNSVISKMHRRGYRRPDPPNRTAAACKANKLRRLVRKRTNYRLTSISRGLFKPTSPLPPTLKVDVARLRFDQLEAWHCRWPVGNPRAAMGAGRELFCGARRTHGPYCEHHANRAYDYVPAAALDRHFELDRTADENGAQLVQPRAGVIKGTSTHA